MSVGSSLCTGLGVLVEGPRPQRLRRGKVWLSFPLPGHYKHPSEKDILSLSLFPPIQPLTPLPDLSQALVSIQMCNV